MIQIIVPGIVVNAKDKKPVVGADVTVFLLGETKASVPLEVLKTKTGAGGVFIAVSKARDDNIDIKRIIGRVVCPKPCKPTFFTAPPGGKVDKKGTFFKTAKSYFEAGKNLNSGNLKDAIDGANSVIQGATRVVVTHKVSQRPVRCCAKVRAGYVRLFQASEEKLKKTKKKEKFKSKFSRFQENDTRRAFSSAAEQFEEALINFSAEIQRRNNLSGPESRFSLVLEGRAENAGEMTFVTGSSVFTQTISAGETARDIAERLGETLLETGFTVFGPDPASGKGIALHLMLDADLLPVSGGRIDVSGTEGIAITRLGNRRFFTQAGFGGPATMTWRNIDNTPPVLQFQDADTGEIFEHTPDIPAQPSGQALADALQKAMPNALVEVTADGDLRIETFGGSSARLVGVGKTRFRSASVKGSPLSIPVLRTVSKIGVPPKDLTFIEEIGQVTSDTLKNSGVSDLSALESIDPESLRIPGLGVEQLRKFVGMAKIARTFPELSKDDVQVLVEGLGISDDADLLSQHARLNEDDIRNAAQNTETPREYQPTRLINLMRRLRR